MKLHELPSHCKGKNAQVIDYLIKNTDEYKAASQSGSETETLKVYAAALLLLRGDAASADIALARATSQGKAVDGAIEELVDEEAGLTWVPSGPIKGGLVPGNDFVKFLSEGTELDLAESKTKLNCWEAILVSAMYGGLLQNGTGLFKIYSEDASKFTAKLSQALVSGAGRSYKPDQPLGTPARGDIVLFNGLDHVAIATGDNGIETEILSFWPAPEHKEFGPGTTTEMARTTIEAIGVWLTVNMPSYTPNITFGAPDWSALNQL